MIRRPLNVAAVLLLLVAALLAIAYYAEVPRQPWWLGNPTDPDGWNLVASKGIVDILHPRGAYISVNLFFTLRQLGVAFALGAVALLVVAYRRYRRRQGFPVHAAKKTEQSRF